MKKKFLALVLTLAMVLSLVPVTALATGTTQPNIQNPTSSVKSEDGYVDLEKTAAAVEESDNDNTFEITLKATVRNGTQEGTKTSTNAVLVIDSSKSMRGNRINSAQEAAKQFAEVVLGSGANEKNQIAVVSYAGSATTNIELSSDLKAVKNAINFSANGGTNIQAGIKAARDILKNSTANNKVILVLSDGEPTYSFLTVGTATKTGCKIDKVLGIPVHHGGEIDSNSVKITGFNYKYTVGNGIDYTTTEEAELHVNCEHNRPKTDYYKVYQNHGQPTIQEASYAKEDGCEIYSIYLGNSTDTNAVSTMKGIATDETSHYKLATDASKLGELFKGIAKDITLPVTPGIVTDPMGDHMKLVADSLQGNSAVSINNNNSGFTWDLTQVTPVSNTDGSRTYELKYQITFDTNFDGFNAGTFYPTNQETTLSYTVQGDQKTASFPIPKVKGTAAPTPDPDPTTEVYVYFKMVDAGGNPVDKTKFNNADLQQVVYNSNEAGHWATLGKISVSGTIADGTYTGQDGTLTTVGAAAMEQLKNGALYSGNAGIAPTVLAHIQWTKLAQLNGADDYVEAGTTCWHLDGQITGYKVTYATGAGNENVNGMPTSNETYYLSGSKYTVSDAAPTRTGYTFAGWKSSEGDTVYKTRGDMQFTMPNKDVTLTAQWTPSEGTGYMVEYYLENLDDAGYTRTEQITNRGKTNDRVSAEEKTYDGFILDKTIPGTKDSGTIAADGSLVLKLYYTRNSYNVTYQYEGTAPTGAPAVDTLSAMHKYGAEVTVDITVSADAVAGYTFSGWSTADATVTDGKFTMPATNVTLKGKFEEKTNPLTYTINQHFMDGEGKEIPSLYVSGDSQTGNKDTLLSDLIKDKAVNQTNENKSYVYVSSKTTYTVGEEVKSLETTSKLTENTTIDLYYYLDVIGGKDEKGNLIDKGDKIPDCYQVTIIYKSSDESRGKISDASPKKEVLTITDKDGNRLSSGRVEITGASAEVTGSRCYFSRWTNDAKVDTSKVGATLGKQTFNANGGAIYTFTANFDRSSGGSGGSNRPKPPVVEIPDDVPTGLNGKDHYAYVVGYPDGMVYPQKNITRAEVATIFFRLLKDETREANMTKSNGYNDMKDGAWYTCAVSTLSKMGIIKGYEDGSFKPDASISRAEFAAIAARFDPDGDKTPATFSDVSSHWAKDEISIAANHGWIKGYEDGSFKPDQKITRAETMTLVNRVLKRLPETKDDLHKDMKTWPDNQNESAWFYLAVQEATNSHYQKLKKDGTHETWESMRETRDWAALEK